MKNVVFIFCGSNQTKMQELFNHAGRPFFASTASLHIDKIDRDEYAKFIARQFGKHKIPIDNSAIDEILTITEGYTYYTQRLCHDVFEYNAKKITEKVVRKVAAKLLQEYEGVFFQYRQLLTPSQWNLLLAIAKEERVEQPFSRSFITKYQLGTAAIVKRSLTSLIAKEMIYHYAGPEESHYAVYDKFLMWWIQSTYQQ